MQCDLFCFLFLLSLAICFLEPDIFCKVSFFPGDLQKYVLQIKVDYWKNNPAQLARMLSLLNQADLTRISNDQGEEFIKSDIGDAINDFLGMMLLLRKGIAPTNTPIRGNLCFLFMQLNYSTGIRDIRDFLSIKYHFTPHLLRICPPENSWRYFIFGCILIPGNDCNGTRYQTADPYTVCSPGKN